MPTIRAATGAKILNRMNSVLSLLPCLLGDDTDWKEMQMLIDNDNNHIIIYNYKGISISLDSTHLFYMCEHMR